MKQTPKPEIANARHLLLHGRSNQAWPGLWRIKKGGLRIFTAGELVKHDYPSPSDPAAIYAIFDLEPDLFYYDWKWGYAKLPGKNPGFAAAEPFAISLIQVLAVHWV